MFVFLGHLFLYINFDPPEQKRPQHLVKPLNQTFIVLLAALNHSCQRVGKPFFEFPVGLENMGHEEVHERPQLHQAVLERRARQQQTPMAEVGEDKIEG